MRRFEGKQGDTILLEKLWIRNEQVVLSSSDVTVHIFSTSTGFEDPPTEDYTLYTKEMFVAGDKAILNSEKNAYQYSLQISNSWDLGIYLVRWTGTIQGGKTEEYDKIYVLGATRQDIADTLNMPSSVSANGITISYSERLDNMLAQRPVEVGRITKRRNRAYPDTLSRDYRNRRSR